MKRFLAVFLTLALLLTGMTLTASAATADPGVTWDNGNYYYKLADGSNFKGGWKEVTDTYDYGHEDEDGNWVKDGTETYTYWVYAKADGKLAYNEWLQLGSTWYYFSWVQMATGSITIDGTAYLFDKSGAWTGLSGKTPGWIQKDGAWYYLGEDSWTDEEGHKETYLYFANGGTDEINGQRYAFGADGKMLSNGWKQPWIQWDDTDWVYANADGTLATGWKKIDGTWYYFSKYGWMYQDGLYWFENNEHYAFDKSGAMVTGWYKQTSDDGKYTWWYFMDKNTGKMVTGWLKDGGKWYYLDWACWTDGVYMIDDVLYAFDKSGAMVEGWAKYDDTWYYSTVNGVKCNEWYQDGNTWYYFGEYGEMYANGTYEIKGAMHQFDASGAWVKEVK